MDALSGPEIVIYLAILSGVPDVGDYAWMKKMKQVNPPLPPPAGDMASNGRLRKLEFYSSCCFDLSDASL